MAYSLHCGNAVPAVNRDFRVLCPEAFYFASQVCILFPLSHCGAGPCALAAAAEHQSVLTASALHRGLPMACISKRVCKLSVVCSHLRKKKKKKQQHRETLSTASNSGDPSLFPRPLQTCAIKEGRLWPPLVAHHLASVMLKNAGTAYCNPTKHFWEGRRTKSSCG